MTIYEIINTSLSTLAILGSIISFFRSASNSMVSFELTIGDRLSKSKNNVRELIDTNSGLLSKKESGTLNDEEKGKLEIFKRGYKVAIEENLNVYDEMCTIYLDKKVNRKRFKKKYKEEIKQLVECKEYIEYFDPIRSKHKSILEVYLKWDV